MEDQSFDRIARLLGGAASRRAGLGAALGAALGLAGITGGEARKDREKGKGKDKRKHRTPKPEGPCGDRSRKDNLCTKNSECCTGFCLKGLDNLDGLGRCRCIKKGQDCTQSQTCCGKLSCIDNVCAKAQSGPCTLIPDFSATSCASDAECCSGICSIVPGNDGKSVGRCISATTVWVKLTWTGFGDLDSWTWMPPGTTNQSGTGSSFPNGGDAVMWQRLFYPWLTATSDSADSFASPAVTPDVWLDVDDTYAPGSERTLFFKPVAGGTYRFAVHNYGWCPSDDQDPVACGLNWTALVPVDPDTSTPYATLTTSGAKVEIWVGKTLRQTFDVPTSVAGDATHYYWWHVADLQFGSNGQLANILPGGGQPTGVLATCAPTPVAMTTFIVDADIVGGGPANERSNYCV